MNERITVYKMSTGQNEDGEIVDDIQKEHFTCWAEVPKATTKEFRNRTNQKVGQDIDKRKNQIQFHIRYRQKEEVDSSMRIRFRGKEFQIVDVETDFMRKDFTMISAVIIE